MLRARTAWAADDPDSDQASLSSSKSVGAEANSELRDNGYRMWRRTRGNKSSNDANAGASQPANRATGVDEVRTPRSSSSPGMTSVRPDCSSSRPLGPITPQDIDLPSTVQAIRILNFLKVHLANSFHQNRFAAPDTSAIHRRDPSIVAMAREWMPYLEILEPDGIPSVIDPLHHFFQSGIVLTWIEVMATAKQLRIALETASALRRWADGAKKHIETQFPTLLDKLEIIHSWAKDVAFVIIQFAPCLKVHPTEIYYIPPTFLPRGSLMRVELERRRFEREKKDILNFFEREDWEPYKFVKLPVAVTSDSCFLSEDMARFCFNSKGSLLAYRGLHQVVVFAAYTSTVIATFEFPKRRIASASFAPRAPHLLVMLMNGDSQVVDLRNGIIMEENPESSSSSQSHGGSSSSESRSNYSSSARVSVAATFLEERAYAAGPDGLTASFSVEGVFKVSREMGEPLFSRILQMDIPEKSNKPFHRGSSMIRRGLSKKWKNKNSDSTSDLTLASISEKQDFKEGTSTNDSLSNDKDVQFKCYDISTVTSEGIVMDRLLQKCPTTNEKSTESGCEITFNNSGLAAILHTTNAFGANLDVLHVANHSTQQLHLVYPLPPQHIGGFSVSSEGDTIALMPQHRRTISIIRLGHGIELYRIDARQHSLSPIVGFTFTPGNANIIMTAHAANHTVYWDIKRLGTMTNVAPLTNNPYASGEVQSISSQGNRILLKSPGEPGIGPLLLQVDSNNTVEQIPIKRPLFNRCRQSSSPILLSQEGASALVGQYLYTFSPKSDIRSFTIPKNSRIVRSAIFGSSTVAFAVIEPDSTSHVRIYNWARMRGSQDWIPGAQVLNIWGLAFDAEGESLAVGAQMKSNQLDRFTVFLLSRGKSGKVRMMEKMVDWESLAPISLAFRKDGRLIVLTRGEEISQTSASYSVLTFKISALENPEGHALPLVQSIPVDPVITPVLASNGELFYFGAGRTEGWIIQHDIHGTAEDERKIGYVPLSWRRLGQIRIVSGGEGNSANIVCFNKVFGSAVIKMPLAS